MDSPFPSLLVPSLRACGVDRVWSFGAGLGAQGEHAQLLVLEDARESMPLIDLERLDRRLHNLVSCRAHQRFEIGTHLRRIHQLDVR
jgi:hypothetical protein